MKCRKCNQHILTNPRRLCVNCMYAVLAEATKKEQYGRVSKIRHDIKVYLARHRAATETETDKEGPPMIYRPKRQTMDELRKSIGIEPE